MDEQPEQDETEQGGADPLELVVVQRLDGFPAHLRRLPDGSLALEGVNGAALPALAAGERLRVTRPVTGDATYVQPARVLQVQDDEHGVRIRTGGETERNQQRRFVRVVTQPIDVVMVSELDGEDETAGSLRDLSAGGVRAVIEGPGVEVGTQLRIRFELPRETGGSLDMDLRGEVVWAGTVGDDQPAAGIQFAGTDEATEAKLTRWVFRQESKRSR